MSDAKLSFVDELKAVLHKADPDETDKSLRIYRALLLRIDALERAVYGLLAIIEKSGLCSKADLARLRSTIFAPDLASRAHKPGPQN